jgi:hypothetical protein
MFWDLLDRQTIAGIVMLLVVLLFLGISLDAGRDKRPPSRR